ncbi:hypothetical protein ACHAXM_002931 [Skeletonema potamos]
MFLSHWFEFSGIDKVMAPIPKGSNVEGTGSSSTATERTNETGVNNAVSAMNDEENPFWSIVAPRQKPLVVKKNSAHRRDNNVEEQMMVPTKAPPVEMFRQKQPSDAIQCMHCHKMTPINSSKDSPFKSIDDDDDDDGNENSEQQQQQQILLLQQTLQEKEQALKAVTQARRELEEEMEKMRLELEVMKIKIGVNGSSSGGRAYSTVPHVENNSRQPTTPADLPSLLSHQPADEPIDEATYIKTQVLAAATDTAETLTSPIYIWEKRKNIFERCSAAPKKKPQKKKNATQQQQDGNGEEYSVNLKKLIKDFKKYPGLVNIRSANMPPLPDGYTVLHAAVHGGNVEVVEYLLQEYVLVDSDDDDDSRPILDLNVRDLQGRTALHICAEMGHTEILPLLQRAYDLENVAQMKKKAEKNDIIDDDDDDEGQLSNAMDKLDTLSITTTPITPAQQPRTTRSKSRQKSRSPKQPSSSHLSLKFAGSAAPIDLSGRTPLGYAATSPIPKAKNNRAQLERMLYMSGDRSIVGERTPPRERSGGLFTPPRGENGKKVGFHNNDGISDDNGESSGNVGGVAVGGSGLTSYLSPTPRKKAAGRTATPFHAPVSSAMKTVPEETITNSLAWASAEMPGMRVEMEDATLCQNPLDVPPKPSSMDENKYPSSSDIVSTMGVFGVFDGHGDGGFASQFISSNLVSKLQSNPSWNVAYHDFNLINQSCTTDTMESIVTETCNYLDDDLKNEESKPRDGGSTAIVALVSSRKILVANVGDSRCILVRKRTTTSNNQDGGKESTVMSQIEVIPMSEDHKPDLPDERARIESAGLEVHTDQIPPNEDDENGQYVMISKVKKSNREMLGVSRAFGDYDYKSNENLSSSRQAVVCTPDIVVRDRVDSDDMFLILACDGVWDVMSNDEVGLFVTRGVDAAIAALAKEDQPAEADVLASVGDGLLAECLEKGSADNMSVLIVALPASGLSMFGNASDTARALAFE